MPIFHAPLVGAHFRPPAKALLASLPAGHPLELRPEPQNPYDPNAVAVWLDTKTLPAEAREELVETLEGTGFDLESMDEQRDFHVGYMAAASAAQHIEAIGLLLESLTVDSMISGQGPFIDGLEAKLSFTPSGSYQITFFI
jgi:hypothetical protein